VDVSARENLIFRQSVNERRVEMKKANPIRERGFTLIELIFVLAIILTLVALLVPVASSKLRDAQLARANADVQTIAVALISFLSDLDHFPACDSTNCNPLSSSNLTLRFLAFGDGTGDLSDKFPADDLSRINKWNLSNPANISIVPARNNGFNHLGRNDPNADNFTGSGILGMRDYDETSKIRWKGPYIANVSLDPWGHTYVAHVGAMEENGIPVFISSPRPFEKPEGWILSAGPDGVLQTSPTDTTLSGDDIGFILLTSRSAGRFARR
jgi:prepilin-type N-terminal cleavage/methylation domain-containing protein